MLDLYFMAAFADAWPTVVEPLSAWRVLGLKRAEEGYTRAADQSLLLSVPDAQVAANVGEFLQKAGLYEAATCLTLKARDLLNELIGPHDRRTLMTSASYIGLLSDRGMYREAIGPAREHLKQMQKTLRFDDIEIATGMGMLAILLGRVGECEEAEDFYRIDLEFCKKHLDAKHPYTLNALSNFAQFLTGKQRFSEAEPLHHLALECRESTLGADHPETLISVAAMGVHYENQDDFERAEPFHIRDYETTLRCLGSRHPDTLVALSNLAFLRQGQHRFSEAKDLHARALEFRMDTLGERHPACATSAMGLSRSAMRTGDYREALDACRLALRIRTEVFGEAHSRTLLSMELIPQLLAAMGRHHHAIPLFREALECRRAFSGREHHGYYWGLDDLSRSLEYVGMWAESATVLEEVLNLDQLKHSPDDPQIVISRINLAWSHLYLDTKQAKGGFQSCLESWSDSTEWKHHWARLGLALCDARESGDFSTAEAVIADLIVLLGEDHDRVAKGREKIAIIRQKVQDSHPFNEEA